MTGYDFQVSHLIILINRHSNNIIDRGDAISIPAVNDPYLLETVTNLRFQISAFKVISTVMAIVYPFFAGKPLL